MSQTSNLSKHFKNQTYDVKKLLNEFTKEISQNKFFRNYDHLLNDSEFVKFSKDNWIFKPYNFCKDYYEEPYFYPVVLLINNIGSMFDFKQENFINNFIIAPRKSAIIYVMSLV